jgi:hypothetical protein
MEATADHLKKKGKIQGKFVGGLHERYIYIYIYICIPAYAHIYKSVSGVFMQAAIAPLGQRQTEDLKVPGLIPGLGISTPWYPLHVKHNLWYTTPLSAT